GRDFIGKEIGVNRCEATQLRFINQWSHGLDVERSYVFLPYVVMGKHQTMKAQPGLFLTSTNSKTPENSPEGKVTARPLQVKIEVHFS
ncbi:hypothetical protein MC885_006533, partial [Smutsia gigantea]